jgi:predicted small lipoprotein YifL
MTFRPPTTLRTAVVVAALVAVAGCATSPPATVPPSTVCADEQLFSAVFDSLKSLDLTKVPMEGLRLAVDRVAAVGLRLQASAPPKLVPVIVGLEGDIAWLNATLDEIGTGSLASNRAAVAAGIDAVSKTWTELHAKLAPQCGSGS